MNNFAYICGNNATSADAIRFCVYKKIKLNRSKSNLYEDK